MPYIVDYVNYPEVTDLFTAIDYGLTSSAALSGFTTGDADHFVCKAEGIKAENQNQNQKMELSWLRFTLCDRSFNPTSFKLEPMIAPANSNDFKWMSTRNK